MLQYNNSLLYHDTPRSVYKRYKERYVEKSRIWRKFDRIFEISRKKELDNDDKEFLKNAYPSLRKELKEFTEDGRVYREFVVRNYLLENPALLEYVFPEILLCFAEVKIFPKGVGAKPDIILAQESHRKIPRHYLMIELKKPTSYTKKKKDRKIEKEILEVFLLL